MTESAIHVWFTGKVQGVGFRYTTRKFADALGLKGWVKNLPNGQVEMWAEGKSLQLEHLMAQLEDRFEITDLKKEQNEKTDEFAGFFDIGQGIFGFLRSRLETVGAIHHTRRFARQGIEKAERGKVNDAVLADRADPTDGAGHHQGVVNGVFEGRRFHAV